MVEFVKRANRLPGPSSHFAFVQQVYERLKRRPATSEAGTESGVVPDGLRAWGLERFLFSQPEHHGVQMSREAMMPRNIGDRFIRNYFQIVHPQLPILIYSEVIEQWAQLWKPPGTRPCSRGEDLVFMVLAIGARVSLVAGQEDLSLTEGWAEYFSRKADISMTALSEPTLSLVHLLLLKVR